MNIRNGTDRSRMGELLVYTTMWLVLCIFPLILELIDFGKGTPFFWRDVFRWWVSLLPYVFLFIIHNFLLIPRCLFAHRFKAYAFLLVVVISTYGVYQYTRFELRKDNRPEPHLYHAAPPEHFDHDKPMLSEPHGVPLPVALDLLLGILMLGFNIGIAMLFKSYKDQEARAELESMRLQGELKYLKAQINPHFFMNMLNNIHAAVEVDPVRAQDMILELSKLMRYVLYEGENETTTFADEVRFISSYLALMRQRYPSGKVEINFEAPADPSDHVVLPPLLFVSFVENAFKHGVSYMTASRISIILEENDGMISFSCINTKHKKDEMQTGKGGVGLENVKRRLALLYQGRYVLNIKDNDKEYNVKLIIPCL